MYLPACDKLATALNAWTFLCVHSGKDSIEIRTSEFFLFFFFAHRQQGQVKLTQRQKEIVMVNGIPGRCIGRQASHGRRLQDMQLLIKI